MVAKKCFHAAFDTGRPLAYIESMEKSIEAEKREATSEVTLSELLAAQDLQPLGGVSRPADVVSEDLRQSLSQ